MISIIISGKPGTGKTTLALLLVRGRATIWLNAKHNLDQIRDDTKFIVVDGMSNLNTFKKLASKSKMDFVAPNIDYVSERSVLDVTIIGITNNEDLLDNYKPDYHFKLK